MNNQYVVQVSQAVVFVDPTGEHHAALVTAVWGPDCVNIVFVTQEEGQTDTYGQKIQRYTSVMHRKLQQAHGNYWYDPDNRDNVRMEVEADKD